MTGSARRAFIISVAIVHFQNTSTRHAWTRRDSFPLAQPNIYYGGKRLVNSHPDNSMRDFCYTLTLSHRTAGVKDNFLAGVKPFKDLRFRTAGTTRFDHMELSATGSDDKGGPIVTAAEESAGGNFESIIGFPGDDACFDAEVIANRGALLGRGHEVGDNIDALLFDTKSRNFCEGSRLHQTNLRGQRLATAPLLQFDFCARRDDRAIAREDIDDYLQVRGITDLHQGRSTGHYSGILF